MTGNSDMVFCRLKEKTASVDADLLDQPYVGGSRHRPCPTKELFRFPNGNNQINVLICIFRRKIMGLRVIMNLFILRSGNVK